MTTLEHSCPSELTLDRLFVGELHDATVREHTETCTRCATRIDERKTASATFDRDVGLDLLVRATEQKIRGPHLMRTVVVTGGALAAAAAVFLVVRPKPTPTEDDGIRTKGGLSLSIVAKHLDGKIETLVSPAQLVPGEAIQFSVSAASPGFLGIIGVDSAASITPYAPAQLGVAMRVSAGTNQLLEGSIVLDGTLGPERIFAVLCQDEIEMDTIVAGARSALTRVGGNPAQIDVLSLPATCAQTSFLIEKKPT